MYRESIKKNAIPLKKIQIESNMYKEKKQTNYNSVRLAEWLEIQSQIGCLEWR